MRRCHLRPVALQRGDIANDDHTRIANASAVVVEKARFDRYGTERPTELESDPGFQSALGRVSTRFGANLGLDAVDLALGKLAANPAAASAVPGLREQVPTARRTISAAAKR